MGRILKLLDEIILPLILLISARYLGVFVSQMVFSVNYTFARSGDSWTLPFVDFAGPNGQFFANSLSWIFVAGVTAFYFGIVLFRTLHFHKDKLHPRHSRHIHEGKLEFLLIDSRDAFYQSLVWVVLSLILIFLATLDVYLGILSITVWGLLFAVSSVLIVASTLNYQSKVK